MPEKSTSDKQKYQTFSTKNPLVWVLTLVLLIFIVVAFVALPMSVPYVGQGAGGATMGKYDGHDIDMRQGTYFYDRYQLYARNSGDFDYFSLKQTFRDTVNHLALLDLAKQNGLTVTDEQIGEHIGVDPRFQENGRFSADKFTREGFTKKAIADDMVATKLQRDIANGTIAWDAEQAFIVEMGRWNRTVNYVTFEYADYPDSEAAAFAQKHPDTFRFIDISTITVANKTDAANYRQQIVDKKASFEDLAKLYSTDNFQAKSGLRGPTGWFELKSELKEKADADAVVAMKAGDVSQVLPLAQGYAIIRANAAATGPDFADLGQTTLIRNYIQAYEKGSIEDYLSAKAKDFAAAAQKGGMDKAAAAIGKKVLETNSFALNYDSLVIETIYGQQVPAFSYLQGNDGRALSDADKNENFFLAAFKLKPKELSDPIVLKDSVVVISPKSEKTANDTELNMLLRSASTIAATFQYQDLANVIVKKDKIVDNVDKIYLKHQEAAKAQQ